MVPNLYLIGQLPAGASVCELDVMTAYPNRERLVVMQIAGTDLQQLVRMQSRFSFALSAHPVWLDGAREVTAHELHADQVYTVVTSELAAEGGLGWSVIRDMQTSVRHLDVTCSRLVWSFLAASASALSAR
jgi:hypothetical protein